MITVIHLALSQAVFLALAVSGLPAPGPVPDLQRSPAGTAKLSLTGGGISVSGDYPTTLCGGPYMLGRGISYQAKAGEWQITVASETRTSGEVPLNTPDGDVNVVVTANARGKNFVRGPRNAGTLEISSDFLKAEGTFTLRRIAGTDTVNLAVTFTCTPDLP